MSKRSLRIGFVAVMLALALYPVATGAQQQKFPDAISNTWASTDWIVWSSTEARTWMWGPGTFDQRIEPYAQSPNGQRQVFFYDKARMEITQPDGDTSSIWYVTNGLLVVELMTGRLQIGDNEFEDYFPAQVNVAGDFDDANGPTYATMGQLRNLPPHVEGANIIARINRAGTAGDDQSLASYGVTAGIFVPETGHRVATPFWNFMNSTGKIYDPNTRSVVDNAPLFPNPYFATGFPVTEAYWSTVKVGNTPKTVLVQCFERRCLTYTPDNSPEWQVEAGNVGQHYHTWRYEDIPLGPPDDNIPPVPEQGDLFYQSDMTDWATGTVDQGQAYVADGVYRIRVTGQDAVIWSTFDFNLTDYIGQFETRVLDPNTGQQESCLVSRYDVADGFTRNYSFCINQAAEVYAFYEQWDSQGNYEIDGLLETSAHPAVHPATEWNTLRVALQGNQLWFIVNGEPIAYATHDTLTAGDFGAAVYNYNASPAGEWEFRNAAVWLLTGAPPPPPPPPPADEPPAVGGAIADYDLEQLGGQGQIAEGVWASVSGNAYQLQLTGERSFFIWDPNSSYGDASVSLDVRHSAGSADSAACLFVRVSNTGEYDYCFFGDGSAAGIFFPAQGDGQTILASDFYPGFNAPSEWNTLEIRMRGNKLWFMANNVLVGAVTHDGSSSGAIGFQIYSFEDDTTQWSFQNLTVRALQ